MHARYRPSCPGARAALSRAAGSRPKAAASCPKAAASCSKAAASWPSAAAALWLAAVGLLWPSGCQTLAPPPATPATPSFVASPLPLKVPMIEGWVLDPQVPPLDPNTQGGVVLRLIRESHVVGSPRIEVVLEPPPVSPTLLQSFLTHSLQEMAHLERGGQVHINHVEQRPMRVGSHPAYRVRHEYTVGQGAGSVAINQVSTLFVLSGRGVAVSAAGRVELFHPLSDSILKMLDGLQLVGDSPPAAAVEPEDLGTVGGSPKSRESAKVRAPEAVGAGH